MLGLQKNYQIYLPSSVIFFPSLPLRVILPTFNFEKIIIIALHLSEPTVQIFLFLLFGIGINY